MTERPLPNPRWMRATARSLLFTFTTSILVACGGTPSEAPATTTTLAQEAPPTTLAQATIPPPPPPPAAAAQPPPTLPAEAPPQLGKDELRELVAPVALYPDVVLASLLPATTYPDQIRDAAGYVGNAEIVESVPEDRGWDGSINGLLQFPDVLRWLDSNPAWTDEMGQAVTYQQGDVLQAIQDYRQQVQQAGNLKSNQYQKVVVAPDRDILIQPAQPDIVYVPSYDPVAAVQPQPVVVQEQSPGINPWIAFGGGALVGALGAYALYSIFDDDDGDTYNYYGGGRRGRYIRGYDNYYYNRGRRPRYAAWNPRPRPYRAPNQNWRRPQRLRYANTAPIDRKRARALRAPVNRAATQAPTPKQVRQQQRQENRQLQQQLQRDKKQQQQLQRQERQQAQQQQRQEKKQAQQMQKQQRQEQQRQNRQEKQVQQQQRQQQQREQRQQRQQQQRDNRQLQQQQRQQKQQEQQQQRQMQQQQRQQQRQVQQQQRQEKKQAQQIQRQENRQQKQGGGGGGGGGGGNKKKKQKND